MKILENVNRMTQQQITVKDAMNLKVMHLNLCIRTYNCLRRVRIETLFELTKLDGDSLKKSVTIGKKSIAEIESNLHLFGLKFRMSEQDWEIWTLEHEALVRKLLLDERIYMLNNLKDILFFIENNSGEIIGLNEYMYMCEDFTKSWLEPVLAQIKIPIVKDEKLWEALHEHDSSYSLPSLPTELVPQIGDLLTGPYGGKNYKEKIEKLMEFRSQIIDIYINKEKEENK